MNELAVIDYCTGTIDMYKIESSIQSEDIERKLEELGYDMDECYYMVAENIDIRYPEIVI